MYSQKLIFFRNDDVRSELDESLIFLTDLFIRNNIPIVHAVEPANVNQDVANWLITLKRKYPSLIEIVQHGYTHNFSDKYVKMEFGGKRSFRDQYDDILKGKELMDKWFGALWAKVFTFPYGTYNKATLMAISNLGYIGISTGTSFINKKTRIKNKIGTFLKLDFILNKKISYHNKQKNRHNLVEIATSINPIEKYINEEKAIHKNTKRLISEINLTFRFTTIVGILLHHRFHKDNLQLITELVDYVKTKEFSVKTLSTLIELKKKQL